MIDRENDEIFKEMRSFHFFSLSFLFFFSFHSSASSKRNGGTKKEKKKEKRKRPNWKWIQGDSAAQNDKCTRIMGSEEKKRKHLKTTTNGFRDTECMLTLKVKAFQNV